MGIIGAFILCISLALCVRGQIPLCRFIDDDGIVSPDCARDYNLACESLRNISFWALMMFDSNGRPESGKFLGNLVYEGDYDQCVYPRKTGNIEHPLQEDLHFCMGIWPSATGLVSGHALCLPGTCTSEDFVVILKQDHFRPLGDMNVTKSWCYEEDKSLAGDTGAIISISILVLFAFMVLMSSIFHKAQLAKSKDDPATAVLSKSNTVSPHSNIAKIHESSMGSKLQVKLENEPPGEKTHQIENGELSKKPSQMNGHLGEQPHLTDNGIVANHANGHMKYFKEFDVDFKDQDKSKLHATTSDKIKKTTSRILLSFSLYQNVPKVLSAKRTKGSYDCLNGIRFLSMSWVVLGHTYGFLGYYTEENLITGNDWMRQFWFQPIINGTYSVDTFFVLSAVLVTISFMKNMQVPKEIKSKVKLLKHYSGLMGLYYLHRYLRLTPVYAIIVMIHANLIKYLLGNGPFYTPMYGEEPHCKANWWTNLLYINNMVKTDEMCAGHGWYLAVDFQFYFILPLFLAPLLWAEHKRIRSNISKGRQTLLLAGSLVWIGLAIIGSMISRFYIAYKNFVGEEVTVSKQVDPYISPWTRSAVYFMSTYLGYVIYRTKGNIKIPKVVVFLGWLVAAACIIFPLYLPYLYSPYCDGPACTGEWTVAGKTVFYSLDRPMWALGVMWVIFACVTGYGGLANTILSWNGFIPLGRLTYCCYLIHPLVCFVYVYASPVQHHLQHYTTIYTFLGNLCLSTAAAFIFTVLFEVPFLGIQKMFLTPKKR